MKKQLVILLFLLISCYVKGIGQTLDYKYQVAFIYNIAKYTQWQSEHTAGDFIVGILGNKSIATTFEQSLKDKKIANQNIKIAAYNTVADIKYCNILFVPASAKVDLDNILTSWGDKNVLICTERDG